MEESDESLYWLEVTKKTGMIGAKEIDWLIKEANELVSIFNVADITVKKNRNTQTKS